jgi:hypothetical protein
MKRLFLTVWQLPQFLAGEAVLLFHVLFGYKEISRHELGAGNHPCVTSYARVFNIRETKVIRGFSLGRRVFLYYNREWFDERFGQNYSKRDEILCHEYGHCVQSFYLGWLYLIVIALPSLLVTGVSPGMAERFYFEKWADKIAEKVEGFIF